MNEVHRLRAEIERLQAVCHHEWKLPAFGGLRKHNNHQVLWLPDPAHYSLPSDSFSYQCRICTYDAGAKYIERCVRCLSTVVSSHAISDEIDKTLELERPGGPWSYNAVFAHVCRSCGLVIAYWAFDR